MIKDCTCKQCGKKFKGGPRAYYCPNCRAERKKEAKRAYNERKKEGKIRPLGSSDACERCGEKYIVVAGLQRVCEKCKSEHYLEQDRKTGLKYYYENKEDINPIRRRL